MSNIQKSYNFKQEEKEVEARVQSTSYEENLGGYRAPAKTKLKIGKIALILFAVVYCVIPSNSFWFIDEVIVLIAVFKAFKRMK